MIKIIAELNDDRLTISSRANQASVLELYYLLATIIKDSADKIDMNTCKMIDEIKLLVSIEEWEDRVDIDKGEKK